MKLLLNIFITLLAIKSCYCQDEVLKAVRSCYNEANNVEQVQELIRLSSVSSDHPVILAYNNTAHLMLLDYRYNPIKKYTLFKTHTKKLDSIIKQNPTNIELRLLRYTVQNKAPSFLQYNAQLNKDIELIRANIHKESDYLKKYIQEFLIDFNNVRTSNPS